MHLHHGAEDKKVCRCGDLDILHRSDDCTELMTIMAHHRTGIDEVVPAFLEGLAMGRENIVKTERLWSTCYERCGTGGDLQRSVLLLDNEGLRGRHAGNTRSTSLHLINIVRDRLSCDQGRTPSWISTLTDDVSLLPAGRSLTQRSAAQRPL